MKFNDAWEEVRERVRGAADIVQVIGEHVRLRRAGANYTGLCPFHGEKTPSFSVNPQRQSFKCFGCGESGDVFSFLMKYQNLNYLDALKELAKQHQISLPDPKLNAAEQEQRRRRELLYSVNQEAARLYHDFLLRSPQAEAARQYLVRRGVQQEFAVKYQLGYAPADWDFISSRLTAKFTAETVEQAGMSVRRNSGKGFYDRFRNRLMFPITDHSGRVCAFGGRILGDGQPKYMNSPESPIFEKSRILFGLHQHREAIRQSRRAVIVEGNFDLLLLDVHGISNAAAPLGTALTKEHVRALRGLCNEAVLFFDGDAAGLRAARRSVPIFLSEGLEAKAALLPAGHDPDSFVREQGAEAVRQLLDKAAPLPEFIFDALAQEHGLTLSGKNKIMAELGELLKLTSDRAQRELMAAHFAGKLGVSAANLFPTAPLPEQQEMEIPPPPDFIPEDEYAVPAEAEESAPLSAHDQQLLHFLVFYPEHFQTLAEGGLLDYVPFCAPPVREAVSAMRRLAAAGPFAPEQLLAVLTDSPARRLIAGLIQQGGGETPDDEGQTQCAELLTWLGKAKRQQESAALQRQLCRAEQQGEQELVAELRMKIYKIRSGK